jgi:polyribonucleotide nucleotidyltransferase
MIGLSDKNAPNITPLKKSYSFGGKEYSFESGKLGLLTSGAVTMADNEDNILFTSAGFKTEWLNEKASFFPLVVDFQEKFYATGLIGWNRFQRREWRPSDSATLTARLIDRPIRPMFPKGIINDTQILLTVLSASGEKELWSWGVTSSSLALLMTWAPFEGPVSGIKIVMKSDWTFISDPSTKQEEEAKLNLVVAWTIDAITMVEAWANEVSDEEILSWLDFAHNIIKDICNAQIDYISDYKKQFGIPEIQASFNNPDISLYEVALEFLTEDRLECLYDKWKKEFQKELDDLDIWLKNFFLEKSIISELDDSNFVWDLVYKRVKEIMRKGILEKGRRLDGRSCNEVRQIWGETWLLPRTHGSALFGRGMTQALSIATLWGPDDKIKAEWMMPEFTKRYIHHYNFPPYSVWEVRMMRWVGRREIGHWALAERALVPVLPSEEEFPYTMRVVSEIMTCNGSSSMASVCGSTMSLMQAGVPIKSPVSWVAMGMIYDDISWEYKILSDIQAQEDFLWDMDFKLTRSKNGITALQLDVKIKGLKMEIFEKAFAQWKCATDIIMEKMLEIQPEVNTNLSEFAPLIMSINIPESKIRAVIGKGGENVQRLEAEYEVKISIADDGITTVTAKNQNWWNKAIEEIKQMLWTPEVGYKDSWKVVKIIEWVWAIIEYKWKNSWMIHISKLSPARVTNIEDIVKVWDLVEFEIIQVDLAKWRVWLQRKPSLEEIKAHKELNNKDK